MVTSAGRAPDVVLAHWDAYEWEYRLRQGEPSPLENVFLHEFEEGGIEGAILAVGGDSSEHCLRHDDPLLGALKYQDVVRSDIERSDAFSIVTSADDISRARAAGKPWIVLAIEGARPFRGSLHVFEAFRRLGVRVVGLSWNGRNEAADGVGVAEPGGLTHFGQQLVERANDHGILIDVSHLGPRGLHDTLNHSADPVMASHSNARALHDHPRNLWDDQVKAIAAADGVVGISFMSSHLREREQATVSDIVDHLFHYCELVGVDHVCLGPDFTYDPWRAEMAGWRDNQGAPPPDMSLHHPIHRPNGLGRLREELRNRGTSDEDMEKLCSRNVVNLLERVLR